MRGVHMPHGKLLTIILLLYLCQRETNRVKSSVAVTCAHVYRHERCQWYNAQCTEITKADPNT